MTDRELLELAAKAAGYSVVRTAPKYIAKGRNEWALIIRNKYGGESVFDPISDDGDALRLAVKLHLNVTHWGGSTNVEKPGIDHVHAVEHWGPDGDHLAATRRAIVRAAAEIGKAMP